MKFWLGKFVGAGCPPCSDYYNSCCFSDETTLEVDWTCDCLDIDTGALCGSDYDRTDIYPLVSLTAVTGGHKFRWEFTQNSQTSFVEFYATTDYVTLNSDSLNTSQWKFSFAGGTMPHFNPVTNNFICVNSCGCDTGAGCRSVPDAFGSNAGWGEYFYDEYNSVFGFAVTRVANVRPKNCDGGSSGAGECAGFAIGWKV